MLVLAGNATANFANLPSLTLKRATVVFLPATSTTIHLQINGAEDFIAYQAMYNDYER